MSIIENKKILVCYLITCFDNKNSLKTFIEKYHMFKTGIDHELLICFKLISDEQLNSIRDLLKSINYIEYIDENSFNDFDIGSYKRIAEKFPSRLIFFLNGNSYPNCNDWLKLVFDNYIDKSIIATSASNLSLFSSIKLKKLYKFFSFYSKFKEYKKNYNPFPNPHIRTNGFLINSDDFTSFIKDKNIRNKEDAWIIESGKSGLTNYFKSRGFKIYVVNSEGEKFLENHWKLSETFNYKYQDKYIISDNQIRKYLNQTNNEKKISQYKTWGS
tara:strand:- start:683 stop:1498 length:816 start_codon:yes stop_codon:yes gene_type:complete